MDKIIVEYISSIRLGDMQTCKNMSLIPIFATPTGGVEYVTLQEAFKNKWVVITEVSQSGSVPELKVTNTSPQYVLMLDGEELSGSKQNRVLNTSILLKGNSTTVIPVSCTERGRWSYASAQFADSGFISPTRVRSLKSHSVTESLRAERGFRSDQGAIWADIHKMHEEVAVSSPTHAMRDIYTSRADELHEYSKAFTCLPQQQGSLFFINGAVAGLDILSRPAAYSIYHPKLVTSYSLEAYIKKPTQNLEGTTNQADAFLSDIAHCMETRHDSVGAGYDYRFMAERIVGSALVYEQQVIHMAFFMAVEGEPPYRMSSLQQRRSFRQQEKKVDAEQEN